MGSWLQKALNFLAPNGPLKWVLGSKIPKWVGALWKAKVRLAGKQEVDVPSSGQRLLSEARAPLGPRNPGILPYFFTCLPQLL